MKRLNECQNFTVKEKALLSRCYDAIKKISPNAKVILYGSRARGNADPESDYDLLILVENPTNLKEEDIFRQQLFPIEIEMGCVLTVNAYSYRDWNSQLYRAMPFHKNVEREGLFL
ncbi:MAG: nucleotidyltransferase domain-containing protein [Candidatus Atribacteria bacterium]|nr:nucleotidyltransferase domain-containing protein [Candidatus Atribacteria bacterium]